MKKFFLSSLLLVFCGVNRGALGYPEMARHGYAASCTACHISPNGGGILTDYGRNISKDLLSTWGVDGEEKFLYGLVPTFEWLNLGGDVRAVQMWMNTPNMDMGKFIWMQADLEAAVGIQKIQLVGTIGRQEPTSYNKAGGTIFSRRHYLIFRPTDNINIRAGKFEVAYGIYTPDHMISIKRGLRFDEGSESYNLEASWMGKETDLFLSGDIGRPDAPQLNIEKGFAARGGYFFNERFKVGPSYFYGVNDSGKRHLLGPYAILGFTPLFRAGGIGLSKQPAQRRQQHLGIRRLPARRL